MKKLFLFFVATTLGALLINSCSIERRYHRTGFNVNWNNTSVKIKKDKNSTYHEVDDQILESGNISKKSNENSVSSYTDINDHSIASNSDELIQETENNKTIVDIKPTINLSENNSKKSNQPTLTAELEKSVSTDATIKNRIGKKTEMKALVKEKSSAMDDDTILHVVLAFLIPPLAVYLYEGSWTKRCTVNLILTLLCGLPGVIHALVVILGGK